MYQEQDICYICTQSNETKLISCTSDNLVFVRSTLLGQKDKNVTPYIRDFPYGSLRRF
jgi:hypothetical protein